MNAVAAIEAADPAAFTSAFPLRPFAIRHKLVGNPLFSLNSIVDLVRTLPADSIEYNSGKVAIGQDANSVSVIDLDPAEIVRRIDLRPDGAESVEAIRPIATFTPAPWWRANGHASPERLEDIRLHIRSSPNATTPPCRPEDNFFVHPWRCSTICDNRDGTRLPMTTSSTHSLNTATGIQLDYESKSTCYLG